MTRFKLSLIIVLTAIIAALGVCSSLRSNCCDDITADELRRLQENAARGDLDAMVELFFFHENRDETATGQMWLKKAADGGNPDAAMIMYERLSASRDATAKQQALKFLVMAAERGKPSAQEILGTSFKHGTNGVPKDMKRAKHWLRKSALAGDPDAVIELCDLALVEQDQFQCQECITMVPKAMKSVHPESSIGKSLALLKTRLGNDR